MQMLKNSGYTVKFRKEILLSGINGYRSIYTDLRDGRVLPAGWKREENQRTG